VSATGGSSIRNVFQLAEGGKFEGEVHIGDNIYYRSELEELGEYLKHAMSTYETRMYQVLLPHAVSEEPYKALECFTVEDARLFFGREAATEELYEKVLTSRLMILHAGSGAGKTSMIHAGLSPRLIGDSRLPVYVEMRPYEENPVRHLKKAMAPSSLGPWPKMLEGLSLNDFLGLICTYRSPKTRELVIVFDQFEQFLTTLPEPSVRLPFIAAFGDCYSDPTLPVRFVISLRQENLADLDEFEERIPHILHNRYRLLPMSPKDVKEAITGPIRGLRNGVSLEPELVETLIEELGGSNVELTHLQIVCARLYASLPEGEKLISTALYESLGRTETILTRYLEDTLSTLPGYKQEVARIILKELVSSEATNRILRQSALLRAIPPDVSVVNDVLKYLVDNRLLRQGEAGEEDEYELVHAYLAREIFHWIGEDDLESRRAQELLQRQLANWRLYQIPPDPDELNVLKSRIQYLALDYDAREMIFTGCLEQGQDVDFWIGQMEDRNAAARQAATFLLSNKPRREEIAACLKRGLAKDLRADVLSILWPVIDDPASPRRRDAAETIWLLQDWLSPAEKSRIRLILFPVWARRSLQRNSRTLLVTAVFVIPFLTWFIFIRERPVPGTWAVIEAGGFVMGMDAREAEYANEFCLDSATNTELCSSAETLQVWSGRAASATLKEYSILDNEVTFAQYQQCVEEGKCEAPKITPEAQRGINLPATGLSWLQADAYCGWLGGRLPTEAEWEKAARGPDGNYFPWGTTDPDEWDPDWTNIEHFQVDTVKTIAQFAGTDVSAYRVKNMAGNAQEWTSTPCLYGNCFNPMGKEFSDPILSRQEALELIEEAKEQHPPPAKASDFYPIVILRGGSWNSDRSAAFASQRRPFKISESREDIGFRCVCPDVGSCNTPWDRWWIWFGLN